MNVSLKHKQIHRHRELTCDGQGVWGGGGAVREGGLGIWDQQMQAFIDMMDKQQSNKGNYIQYPAIHHNGKECEKEYIYIYIYVCVCVCL